MKGDFGDAATYKRVAEAMKGADCPCSTWRSPPLLLLSLGTVHQGPDRGGPDKGGPCVVIEKPFGHDQASAHALAEELHQYIDESQLYRIDHYLGKMAGSAPAVRQLDVQPAVDRNYIECMQITMAEAFGVEDRGHFYDPVGALATWWSTTSCRSYPRPPWKYPLDMTPRTIKDSQVALYRSVAEADPADYCSPWPV